MAPLHQFNKNADVSRDIPLFAALCIFITHTPSRPSQVASFTERYSADLSRHVLGSFPFSRLVGRRKKSAAGAAGPSSAAGASAPPPELGSDAINALVCELAASLSAGGGEATARFRRGVLDYLAGER